MIGGFSKKILPANRVEKQRLGLRAKSGLDSFRAFGCEEGLFAVFDLKNDFPNEWYNANHPPAGATERVLTIDKLNEKLPIFTKGREPKNILAKDIYLFVSDSIPAPSIAATQGGVT